MATFAVADGTTWLFVARVLQGLATGAAIGVVGAYLLDLQPPDSSRLGSLVNSVGPTVARRHGPKVCPGAPGLRQFEALAVH